MARQVERKDYPLSMRLPEADIAVIDRAAILRGRSRTDFVRDAAVRAAEDVLMETAPLRMSPEGFRAFMTAVSGPAMAVPEIVELFRRKVPWEANVPSAKSRPRRGAHTASRQKIRSKHKGGSKVGS